MIAIRERICVLAISSQVVRGTVGLSAIVPALRHLGHDVWPIPTVVLSNHPGHPHAAGVVTPPDRMIAMVDALDRNGWLGGIDAIITGYLPTAEHVEAAAAIVERVKKARRFVANDPKTWQAAYLCDPVLGDDPKGLYIPEAAAAAIRDHLLPLADGITPNRFELSWLSGRDVTSVDTAVTAARSLGVANTVATSVPASTARLANVNVWPKFHYANETDRLSNVPHGTGDLFSALYLAGWATDGDPDIVLRVATDGVAAAIAASIGHDELVVT